MNFLSVITATIVLVLFAAFLLFAVMLWIWLQFEALTDEANAEVTPSNQMCAEVRDED